MPAANPIPTAVLSFGSKSPEVGILQSLLNSRGFFCGKVDNDFGKLTRNALIRFQQTHQTANGKAFLNPSGTTDRDTWAALFAPEPASAPVKLPVNTDLIANFGAGVMIDRRVEGPRRKFLEVAVAEYAKGVKEIPNGANYGGEVTKYLAGIGAASWCMFLVSWIHQTAFKTYPLGTRHGHCLTFWNAAKKAEKKGERVRVIPAEERTCEPGDLMILGYRDERGRLTGSGHVAIVTSRKGQKFNTLAGNESNALRYATRSMGQPSLLGWVDLFCDGFKSAPFLVDVPDNAPLTLKATR